jgi:D-aspartate ligase
LRDGDRSRILDPVRQLAVVLGRIDLVRALGRAGIASIVVTSVADPVRHSRHVAGVLDPGERPRVDAMLDHARGLAEPPPLFYDSDEAVLLVSRARAHLGEAYRFVLPDAELLEDLLDKGRFLALAQRLDLPAPRARTIGAAADDAAADLRFPLVLKASPYRGARWEKDVGVPAKVIRVDDTGGLREVLARVDGTGIRLIAQELVPGPEDRVESYHVYVDSGGAVAGEFTGRKIRTAPREFGMSTALVLEVNPRFTLWTHVGAVAGVNLPAIVHADLTGRPRPPAGRARPGVRWIWPRADAAVARESGISFPAWLRWALRAETNASFALTDPAPYVVDRLRRALAR